MSESREGPRTGGLRLARERLGDARGLRIALVSHCLLNHNARYVGGASCPGMRIDAIEPCVDSGLGIVQMACPEMKAWGGPWKPLMWLGFGRGKAARAAVAIAFPLFVAWTKAVFRREARRIAREAASWARSGWSIESIVGIDGSPSCGVDQILDMKRCLRLNNDPAAAELDRYRYNRRLYGECAIEGRGLFMKSLEKALAKRGLRPAFRGWDLISELGCRPVTREAAADRA